MTFERRIAALGLGICLAFVISIFSPARAAAAPQTKTVPPKKVAPVMDQMTSIPYYTLRDGMSSTLTLNNLQASATPVTVTIYNMEGKAQILKPITLDPHSFKQIELSDVVVSDEFNSGNIEIAFNGINMAVTSQVSIYSLKNRVSFESREADMMDFESSKLAGIVSLPKGADGFLAVTNAAMTRVTVQLTIGSRKKEISLFPRETNLVKLNDDRDERAPAATLVRLQHSGLPGDIIATGYVLNMKDGYSSAFTMSDPGNLRSSNLAGVHFRAGKPDVSEGFQEGTQFRSPLLLANVGAKPVSAKVSVDYTIQEQVKVTPIDPKKPVPTEDKFSTVSVKQLTIAPGDVQRIELSEELAGLGIASPLEEAGVDISYDGTPGSLIGQLTSANQTGDYSFEVPIKDPADPSAMVEAVYPWTIEKGTNTVLHLKNTTDKSVNAVAVIEFPDGGTYNLPHMTLEPHQSIAIDIQKLKDSKEPDVLKQTFSVNVGHGQLAWHQEAPSTMIGRAEQTNVKDGIAKSFSCNSGCCDNYYFGSAWLSPSSLTGAVGGSGSFEGLEDYWSCGNYHYTNAVAYDYRNYWTTSNSSVATVSGTYTGAVSYVAEGTATIEGNFHYNAYYWDVDTCRYDDLNDGFYPADAEVTVCVPASVRIIDDVSSTDTDVELVYNYCSDVYEDEGMNVWGNDHCYTFQLVDSCGNDITTGNYEAVEHRTASSENPAGQTVNNNTTALVGGQWVDWMTYLYGASPGVPSGTYLNVNQSMHVVNLDTSQDYTVATYCQSYTSTYVYHTPGSADRR